MAKTVFSKVARSPPVALNFKILSFVYKFLPQYAAAQKVLSKSNYL